MPDTLPADTLRLHGEKNDSSRAGAALSPNIQQRGPAMPDTHLAKSARNHIHAEFADMRPHLDRVALQARTLIASLRDIPLPLFANERAKFDAARMSYAEQIKDGLDDLLGDLTGPVWRRAEDAGIDPDATFSIEVADLHTEYAALERECIPDPPAGPACAKEAA